MTPSTTEPIDGRSALPPSLVLLLAGGAGLSVAGLYYNQPILYTIARDLHASPAEIGSVPMLTQLGYSAGILLLAPLGDRLDRRSVIVVKSVFLTVALALAGLAPSIGWLCAASFALGLLATAAQDFVPAAAALAPVRHRGKAVGSVMTGLLLGILLSRIVSGAVAERWGWRSVFFGAAVTIALLGLVSRARLPAFPPTTSASYGSLLASMVRLVRDNRSLRRASVAQALLAMSFSGFWSTLALTLAAPPHHLGSTAAGGFGLAGAAGAVIAPLAGSVADKRGPTSVIRIGAVLVALSFLAMGLGSGSIVVLVIGTVVFDLGVQAALIAHQTIVYGLDPNARSRLNAVLVSVMFVGMAAGAAIGSRLYAAFGFPGVAALGVVGALGALIIRFLPDPSR